MSAERLIRGLVSALDYSKIWQMKPRTNALYIFGPMSGRVGPGGNWGELA